MNATVGPWRCADCKTILGAEHCRPGPERAPCPACGSLARTVDVGLQAATSQVASISKQTAKLVTTETNLLPMIKMVGLRAGPSKTKGWFVKQLIVASNERRADRANDRYTETVTVLETGEVVHHCDERLIDHRGHGSDKRGR
jgi:hypothetical protein